MQCELVRTGVRGNRQTSASVGGRTTRCMEHSRPTRYLFAGHERTCNPPGRSFAACRSRFSRVLTSLQSWARRRFGMFSLVVLVAVVLLIVLDGVSAARHYHVAVALCGVLIVVLVAVWFGVAQSRHRR